jgi:hypothetical protein
MRFSPLTSVRVTNAEACAPAPLYKTSLSALQAAAVQAR